MLLKDLSITRRSQKYAYLVSSFHAETFRQPTWTFCLLQWFRTPDTEVLLDWSKIEQILSSIYASKTGHSSHPLLTLFRGLLLGVWYRLSDVELSQCLYSDLLFRNFCHLKLGGDVPEASTLWRFCNQLVEHNLWEWLLGAASRQLEAKNIIRTEGRITSSIQPRLKPCNLAREGQRRQAQTRPRWRLVCQER